MAIDFNATTSKLENTTAALGITTQMTFLAHVFADGTGEGGFGRVVVLDEAANSLAFSHNTTVNVLKITSLFSSANGNFTFPANDNQWNAVGVSYDAGSTANDPIARVNYAPVTVTRTTAPAGTFTQPNAGFCVGNKSDQTNTWNGMLAHIMVFDLILTAGEMDQACRRPGSVRRGLKLWLPMLHAGHLVDWSGNEFNGTATALTDRVGGPSSAPLLASFMLPSFQTVSEVPPHEWMVPPVFRPNRKRRVAVSGMRPAYN